MTKLLLSLLVVSACTTAESTGITSDTLTCDSTLTYANYGAAVISTNCLSCHNGKENPNLSTQASLQSHASSILQEAVYTTAMPEDADMTLTERQTLGNWLKCGAP